MLKIKPTDDDDNKSKENEITKLDIKDFKSIVSEPE